MAQDVVDSSIFAGPENNTKVPLIQTLNSEMRNKEMLKDRRKHGFKCLINKLRCKKYASATISRPDPTYRVAYLGNVVTGWAKGEGCMEKPLATLWRNYTQSYRPDVRMQLTISPGGLKATTKDHGLTEYWAHRLTTCAAPTQFPRLFCWIYRHEGRRLRHELRCHAVLCSTVIVAKQIEEELKQSLAVALLEFKRDKVSRQNARLSLVNSLYENPTIPRRKILLSTGSHNYKPPLERSKSAPKLTSIEEIVEEEDVFQTSHKQYEELLKYIDGPNSEQSKRKYVEKLKYNEAIIPVSESFGYKEGVNGKMNDIHELNLEERSDMILEELVQSSLRNDLLESCERAWFNALREKPDLIPNIHENGSVLDPYESRNSIVSDVNQIIYPSNESIQDVQKEDIRKTDIDFKLDENMGGIRSFEKLSNTDILKYCGFSNIYNNKVVLDQEEVSLIPVGETQSDFSSLKVYKKRSMSEPNCIVYNRTDCEGDDNGLYCDESGYTEDELATSVGNIVLV